MFLTAFMVTFYKNPFAVVSLQFLNQSFNSNVNFSNSAAAVSVPSLIQKKISSKQTETENRLFNNYVFAAGFACCVSLALNLVTKQSKSEAIKKLMPFASVAVANAINLPISRRDELVNENAGSIDLFKFFLHFSDESQGGGTPLYDDDGHLVGHSSRMGRDSVQKERAQTKF